MRKQILGATAAILGASVLSIGLPTAPTQAAAWKPITQIPFPAGQVTDVDVVSTGPGDAVAAAVVNGAVHAYTAVNGVWSGYAQVRGDVDATGLVLAANGAGDVAIGWEENVSGDYRLRVSRQVTPNSWSGLQLLTPAGSDVVGTADLGIAGNGLVIATATVDQGDQDNQLWVTEWAEGQVPTAPKLLNPSNSWNPSLDVNKKGEALISYTYNGLATDVVTVVRRTPGQGWNLGDSTSNTGDLATSTDVAISDNGQGQVIYAVVKNGFYVAETSRVLPDGTAMNAEYASPLDEYVYEPSVDINATGSALFTWVAKKDGLASIRHSSAPNASYPGASFKIPGAGIDATNPTARVSDSGLKVIQYGSSSYVTTVHRTSSVQPFSSTSTTNAFSPDHAVDVDDEGNAVMVGFKPAGGVFGRFLDAAGPTLAVTPLPANTLATTIPVDWTVSDSLSTGVSSDVYATTAAWHEATHSDPFVIAPDVDGTAANLPGTPGTSYCIQVRSTDTSGNSTTAPKTCTTIPLDDRALLGDGWNKVTNTGNFRNTLATTNVKGRTLSRNAVKVKRLALVVRKTTGGGIVKVTFDGVDLGNFSLDGTGKKKVIPVKTFATVKTGTLTIKVVSATGKLVSIDGVVLAK